MAELQERGQQPRLAQGWWPRLGQQLVVVGCSSPWAYLQLLRHRLTKPKSAPQWVPCFHPPGHVRHPGKARLARSALRWAQRAGVSVLVLSQSEHDHLDSGRCRVISLGFGRTQQAQACTQPEPTHRPFDLVFLGRPTQQKGWPVFVEVVERTQLNSLAYVPYAPRSGHTVPSNLKMVISATDQEVRKGLQHSKLLLLPSDYESFGFAQAEALALGCCVPVLGEWPLWLGISELDWRGCSAERMAERVLALLSDREGWAVCRLEQQRRWRNRAERKTPLWP